MLAEHVQHFSPLKLFCLLNGVCSSVFITLGFSLLALLRFGSYRQFHYARGSSRLRLDFRGGPLLCGDIYFSSKATRNTRRLRSCLHFVVDGLAFPKLIYWLCIGCWIEGRAYFGDGLQCRNNRLNKKVTKEATNSTLTRRFWGKSR